MNDQSPVALVVEDDSRIALLVSSTLSGVGERIYIATRLNEALALVDELKPQVLVADLDLLGSDITDLIARTRAHASCYVVALGSDPACEPSVALATNAYLQKPPDTGRLRGLLEALAGRDASSGDTA